MIDNNEGCHLGLLSSRFVDFTDTNEGCHLGCLNPQLEAALKIYHLYY